MNLLASIAKSSSPYSSPDIPTINQPDQTPLTSVSPIKITFADLDTKKRKLEQVRAALKTEFFGIDKCIDSVIDSIQTWYLLPAVLTRPPIVGLWGMTGVGKTALVRSLVNHLNMRSSFVEVQMDGFSGSGTSEIKTISGLIQASGIEEDRQGIVLLDEFQRFRTVNDKGEDIRLERYADVWMLLSDGRFPCDHTKLEAVIEYMNAQDYWDDYYAFNKAEEEAREDEDKSVTKGIKYKHDIKYKRRFLLTKDEAESIKSMLRLPETIREIMSWEKAKVRQLIEQHLESHKDKPYDYTKCLVFVSGNLDEAFRMSGNVEDCDTSADVFHAYTLKIGVPEIKAALGSRFRPEQIARLGNNHVIYPSLSQSAYMSLIRRTCLQYVEQARQVCGVTFTIDEGVYDEVYLNSVYPTQGTRPVFTSIHKLFGSPLSDGVLWALEHGLTKVKVGLDLGVSSLVFSDESSNDFGIKSKQIHIDFEIRARRKGRTADFNALVAVHEAGHALVYAVLFKQAPVEVAINVASFKGGYNIYADTFLCRSEVLARIATGMAGIVAEEMVFGQDLRSTGCESDIDKSTSMAGQFVRRWAMDGSEGRVFNDMSQLNLMDVEATDGAVETIVSEQKGIAQVVLTEYRTLLLDLSNELIRVQKMDAAAFVAFLKDRIPGVVIPEVKDVNGDYGAKLLKAGRGLGINPVGMPLIAEEVKEELTTGGNPDRVNLS